MHRLMMIAVMAAGLCWAPRAKAATLVYRGCVELPGKAIAGLSGITREGEGGTYLAVMDNSDRVLRLAVELDKGGTIQAVKLIGELRLGVKADREGIAFDGRRGVFFVSDESPGITEHRASDGRMVRRAEVPEVFRRQVVRNQGFESLALSADGKVLWTANERALVLDGNLQVPADPLGATTRVRLLRYNVSDDAIRPAGQFEYVTGGVHDWGGQVGLCDLTALPDGRLLALERSAAMNFRKEASIRTRIYLVDTAGATDISEEAFEKGLVAAPAAAGVKKTLLFDGFVCGEGGSNLEGLCVGPSLGPGRFAVIGVVDSGDGGLGLSRTSVVSFILDLSGSKEAATAPSTQRAAGRGAPRLAGKSSQRGRATTQSR